MFKDLEEKINTAKTKEEAKAILSQEGIELSDDELDNVSGGWIPFAEERYARKILERAEYPSEEVKKKIYAEFQRELDSSDRYTAIRIISVLKSNGCTVRL